MKWPVRPVGSVCLPTTVRDPRDTPEESFQYIDISSVDRDRKQITKVELVAGSQAPSRARKQVASDDVLVSTVRPNLNAVALVDRALDGEIASTGFCVLRGDRRLIDPRFLFFFCRTPQFVDSLSAKVTGAHYPAVSDGDVKSAPFALRPLSEQRRIVELLDQADALRHQRAEADTKADRILPALFLKLFGDPATNPKGWPERRLGELADIASGVTKGKNYDGIETVVVPYMRVANVQDGHLVLDEVKTLRVTKDEATRYALRPMDILLTEGGDPDKLGRGTVWHGEVEGCIHQNHIFRVRPEHGLSAVYLSTLIASERGKRYFLKAAKQTTGIATINSTQLKAFPVLIPPTEMQVRYTAVASTVGALGARQRVRCMTHRKLFSSMLTRAFAGTLTALWRQAHMKELLQEMEHQAKTLAEAH